MTKSVRSDLHHTVQLKKNHNRLNAEALHTTGKIFSKQILRTSRITDYNIILRETRLSCGDYLLLREKLIVHALVKRNQDWIEYQLYFVGFGKQKQKEKK